MGESKSGEAAEVKDQNIQGLIRLWQKPRGKKPKGSDMISLTF